MVDVQDARLLFGHDAAHLEAGPQDAVEGVVGIDVQLLLGFALHVGAAVSIGGVGTQNARELRRLTCRLTIFAAVPMSVRRRDRSPVAPANSA